MNATEWDIIRRSMAKHGLGDYYGQVAETAGLYFDLLGDLDTGCSSPLPAPAPMPRPFPRPVLIPRIPPPPPPVVDSIYGPAPQSVSDGILGTTGGSLTLTSSISSAEEATESVDELFERVMSGIPEIMTVDIPGGKSVNLAIDGWRKYDDRSESVWTQASVGIDVSLADDRSVKVSKAVYYPGKAANVRADIDDIVAGFVKRNTPGGQRVVARMPPPGPSFGDFEKGMFAGNYSGGVSDIGK